MVSLSMILSNLGKKRLYSQPFYDPTKTTFSAIRSQVKKGGIYATAQSSPLLEDKGGA